VKTVPVIVTKHVVVEKPVAVRVPEPVLVERPIHVPVEKIVPVPIEKIIHKPVPIAVPYPHVSLFFFLISSAGSGYQTYVISHNIQLSMGREIWEMRVLLLLASKTWSRHTNS
jgi:hypothetical protein